MAFHYSLFLFFFILSSSSSEAYKTFQVGGKDGWTLRPSESYDRWSGRLRFLINDTLHFKYNGGIDSVLVVNKGDYDTCTVDNPISKLDGGDSSFQFDRSGPFYFITGNKSNCDQGQKLNVVVLALRNRSAPPPRAVATPPSPAAPSPSPAATSPSPATPSPSPPTSSPPTATPSPSPATLSPTPATSSPSPATLSPTPATSSPSPAAVTPTSPPSNTPGSTTPATSPSGGEAPGSGTPADVNSPSAGSKSRPALSGGTTATVIFALWWFY